MTYKKVYENDFFLVIDKSAGIGFHDELEAEQRTLGIVSLVKAQESINVFPVHRLDKMTSGLLLLAKTSDVARQITELFASRDVEKYYLAISDRKPKKKQGWVIGDMEKGRRGSWLLKPSRQKPARTYFISKALSEGKRLYLVKLFTGKTHQIRVALKSIGAPIVGDVRYQDKVAAESYDRGYLHAFGLKFEFGGESYEFGSMPLVGELFTNNDFNEAIVEYKSPWLLSWPKP